MKSPPSRVQGGSWAKTGAGLVPEPRALGGAEFEALEHLPQDRHLRPHRPVDPLPPRPGPRDAP